jgi:hypothetical protein
MGGPTVRSSLVISANERTSGNGAVALRFLIQRLSRAVPECERSAE